jgi:hypothetical protein
MHHTKNSSLTPDRWVKLLLPWISSSVVRTGLTLLRAQLCHSGLQITAATVVFFHALK